MPEDSISGWSREGHRLRRASSAGPGTVRFEQADIFTMPCQTESFDHVLVCFVRDHLARPTEGLALLKDMIVPGGTITVIEGGHGSAYFHPDSLAAHQAIPCQVDLQRRAGGNEDVGRALYPFLRRAGYPDVHVSPRMACVDSSKPALVDGFTGKAFTAMIEGVREAAIEIDLISSDTFDQGSANLSGTAQDGGTCCSTFFKAAGTRQKLPSQAV